MRQEVVALPIPVGHGPARRTKFGAWLDLQLYKRSHKGTEGDIIRLGTQKSPRRFTFEVYDIATAENYACAHQEDAKARGAYDPQQAYNAARYTPRRVIQTPADNKYDWMAQ